MVLTILWQVYMFISAYESIQACQMMEEILGQVMAKLLEAQIHEEPSFGAPYPFAKVIQSMQANKRREAKRSKGKQRGKQRTVAAVFFHTFGALPEAYFLHAIYHFKSQEVKNSTLQTVYDLELK